MEWKTVKLGDVCDFQEGYVNPPQSVPEYFDGSIKWLRATDLNDGYVYKTSRTITERGFHSAKKSAILFKPGTIAISKSGTIGRLGILQDYMCGNRAIINIIPKEDVDTYYIFSLLRSYQHYFPIMAVGSVQKNLYISILETLELTLPPLAEQKRIAAILSSIDAKIENNNRINANLEAQAQALYKSWFVDFEPWGGVMPEDWKEGKIGDIIIEQPKSKIQVGQAKNQKGEFPFFTSGTSIYEYPTALVAGNNIYMNTGGNAGIEFYVGEASYSTDTWCINGGDKYTHYLHQYLLSIFDLINTQYFEGSALKHLKKQALKDRIIYIPSDKVLAEFNGILQPLFQKIAENKRENKRLATLRDTLLPKLMKGEIEL